MELNGYCPFLLRICRLLVNIRFLFWFRRHDDRILMKSAVRYEKCFTLKIKRSILAIHMVGSRTWDKSEKFSCKKAFFFMKLPRCLFHGVFWRKDGSIWFNLGPVHQVLHSWKAEREAINGKTCRETRETRRTINGSGLPSESREVRTERLANRISRNGGDAASSARVVTGDPDTI
jgi:hypothetical protein